MKTIIVDDEPIMLRRFARLSENIECLDIIGQFESPLEALSFAGENKVDLAVLDIAMPEMTGLELAVALKKIRPDMLIVFVTAYDEYIHESNQIGADYYIVKPYKQNVIEDMAARMKLLSGRLEKDIYIQTFGRFTVFRNGVPVRLTGKAKEIFALVVTRRGKEISNEEIYSTIWEDRPYGNIEMKVFYNALKRLRDSLAEEGLSDLLLSTARGQAANIGLFDCDYYDLQDSNLKGKDRFNGEFMEEYAWGEYLLGDILKMYRKQS